jgi:hypothetical protein
LNVFTARKNLRTFLKKTNNIINEKIMRRILSLKIVTVMLLLAMTSINAQDAQHPWHLIAFENEEEVAFYNIEMITGIEATEQDVSIL